MPPTPVRLKPSPSGTGSPNCANSNRSNDQPGSPGARVSRMPMAFTAMTPIFSSSTPT